ncbi:MAG: hypothetical protein QW680_09270 [Pyrobaculum sp.]|jgi:uncharacterized membrane protein HdeD (DUF308 family)
MASLVLIYALGVSAIILGVVYLINTISAPPLDTLAYVRDVVTSILAIALGAVAPVMIKKFRSQ